MLDSFNSLNITQLSHKRTSSENPDKIHKVILDGISDNMAVLVQTGQYGVFNKTYTTTILYYVIKLFSEAYTLQEETTCNGKIGTSGELVVKART